MLRAIPTGGSAMKYSLTDASPSVDFEDLVHATFEAIADVPDFRKARGKQLDLAGLLALIVTGLMSGHHSFRAIAAFGWRRQEDLIPMLGLPRAPSHKTVWRIANGVDPEAVRKVLVRVGGEAVGGLFDMAVAVDGKCMRGSRKKGGDQADVVMAVEHSTGVVLDSVDVPAGSSEKTVARSMIRDLAKHPRIAVFTGDALYADRPTAEIVEKTGKDYLFKPKGGTSLSSSRT
jgi:hypothetical protein